MQNRPTYTTACRRHVKTFCRDPYTVYRRETFVNVRIQNTVLISARHPLVHARRVQREKKKLRFTEHIEHADRKIYHRSSGDGREKHANVEHVPYRLRRALRMLSYDP